MRFWKSVLLGASLVASAGLAQTLNIATVNNPDMITMQKLSAEFEKANPGIKLNWSVLPENEVRQKITADIATGGGAYDVFTIGMYEAPMWGKNGWLVEMNNLPADYDLEDVLKPVRAGLSSDGKLYALPFYAESSFLMYRKDLFQAAKLTMPVQPTWGQVATFAKRLHNPNGGVYGICLRGLPGWGEAMGLITLIVNSYNGIWFDQKWQPQLTSPEWKRALTTYLDLVKNYGPPGVTGNGFTENLTLTSDGKCAMWIDATVAAGFLSNPKTSKVAGKMGWANAPFGTTRNGSHWLWAWALGIPKSTKQAEAAKKFVTWATSKQYIELVAKTNGWVSAPPGTRYSTYANAEYQKAADFAKATLESINTADPIKAHNRPVPYTGISWVGIPEYQGIGTQVSQFIAGIVAGKYTLDDGLAQAQAAVEKTMKEAGYLK